jgi:large subunit ribosomal protein L28
LPDTPAFYARKRRIGGLHLSDLPHQSGFLGKTLVRVDGCAYNAALIGLGRCWEAIEGAVTVMSYMCDICQKGARKARSITRRGKPKKEGGIGLNITGIASRRQQPNLQTIRAIVDGRPKRLRVCTRCLRSGKAVKRPIRLKTAVAATA